MSEEYDLLIEKGLMGKFKKADDNSYGDMQYVAHVLRYYPYGRAFTSGGNQAIVEVALTQLGNVGGEPYWSWYGFDSRVEWCACLYCGVPSNPIFFDWEGYVTIDHTGIV